MFNSPDKFYFIYKKLTSGQGLQTLSSVSE